MQSYLLESILCISGVVLFTVASFVALRKKKMGLSLLFIFLLSALLKIYCSADPYLHEWDERYHALVAKNLIEHPLKPTLYDTPLGPYNVEDWTNNHVWLSKPPLPLWFISVSLWTFGMHEFAVRIPANVLSLASVFLVFFIARKLFNSTVALIAAYLFGIHGMLTDLASGRVSSDSVETSFLFFVLLGMWIVFRRDRDEFKPMDYVLTGICTGLAVMCKWQPGLLILVIMFVRHFSFPFWKHIMWSFIAFVCACFVFLPWVIYCFYEFPAEANWVFRSLFNLLTQPYPNSDGTWYSYLTDFGNYFGYTTYLLCAVAIWNGIKNRDDKLISLLVWALLPLLVFSISDVKRGTYLMIGAPAVFMLISYCMVMPWIQAKRFLMPSFLAIASLIFILGFSIEKLYLFAPEKVRTASWSDEIKSTNYPPGSIVTHEPHYIEVMFYHDGVIAYPYDLPERKNSVE